MKKFKIACIGIFLAGSIFSNSVFGTEDISKEFDINYSDSYVEWMNMSDKEKADTLLPKTYTTEIPKEIFEKYGTEEKKSPNILESLVSKISVPNKLDLLSASSTDSHYNLNNFINVQVKNQESTNQCWAFAILSSMETHIALATGEQIEFSERHMDYATSRTFNDGINEAGFNREVGAGGLPITALAYLTNGQGAVLERDMPFENNENRINLSEIDKNTDTIVAGYASIPTIMKEYRGGVLQGYTNGGTLSYSNEDVNYIRNIIKSYLVNYGAIASITAAGQTQCYNNPNVVAATAYFCNNSSVTRDHAITIVGWDDTYSRENFNENARPHRDGAYIALNSYGTNVFNNGYIYISYEDVLIESELYAITDTSKVDYDKLYQSDYYGGVLSIGTTNYATGYYANIYQRDASKKETLTHVGVTVPDYVKLEIYVNPNSSITSLGSLTKVGETNVLEPGYYRIPVTETQLAGTSFAVVVKQTSENEVFYFSIEGNIPGSVYSLVDAEPGQSLISFDGYSWTNLSQVNVPDLDMTKSDVCIKAFTIDGNPIEPVDPDDSIKVDPYTLDGSYIIKIEHDTKINNFLNHVETELETQILTSDKNEITDYESIVQTGMILKLSNNKEYELIVRGDINCNGSITLTDLSQLILHYGEQKGYILTGARFRAADMNYDRRVSIVDISQLLVLYGGLE